MGANLQRRLEALEQTMTPKGKLLVCSNESEAARLKAKPGDLIITGVPRAAGGLS